MLLQVYLNLVLEFVPDTVYKVTRSYTKMKALPPLICVKLYVYQLARSLAYLHARGICHRDIKPQSLLVRSHYRWCNNTQGGPKILLFRGYFSLQSHASLGGLTSTLGRSTRHPLPRLGLFCWFLRHLLLQVDSRSHVLKLCDFGSAKALQPGEPSVAYICSRYYRLASFLMLITLIMFLRTCARFEDVAS